MNVLLLPATKTAEEVAGQLLEWSAARLLRPFCIWRADDPAAAAVREVCEGEADERPLAAALARAEPGAMRFVALQPAALDESLDDAFAAQVERFLVTAAEVLDFDPRDPLTCTMVVAPAAARQPVPPTFFRANWDGLYVVPEDRAQPGGMNRLVGDPERFPRHAAHAAATIAELWSTPAPNHPSLLAELRDEPAGPLPVRVHVVRCFSRAVELGYVADHVAAAAFAAQEGGWPRPSTERFERVRDPDSIARRIAADYMRKHHDTLGTRPFEPIEEDEPPSLGLIEAIKRLADLVIRYVQRRPFELAEDVLAALHDRAAAYVERLSGSHRIRVKRWNDLPELDHERGLETMRKQLAEPLTIDDGAVRAAWTDLRQLAIGLVDGSELPADIAQDALVRGDQRLLICDPARLALDPRTVAAPGAETDPEPAAELPASARPDQEPSDAPLLEQIRTAVAQAHARAQDRVNVLKQKHAAELTNANANPPGARGPEAERRRLASLARRAILRGLAGAGGFVAAWIWLRPLPAFAATLALGCAWVVMTTGDTRRTLLSSRLERDAWATAELDKLNLALAYAQARGDAKRLERRCDELDTWIAILAELLHHPWVREPFGTLQLPAPVGEETLPAAFAVAAAKPDTRTLERIGARARAHAFHTGWLATIYRTVATQAMEEYRIARRGSRTIEAAADTSADPDPPRRALLAAVVRGDGRHLRDNPLTADLLSSIDGALLDELAPHVLAARNGGRALGPTTTWVDAPPGVGAVAADRTAEVVAVEGEGAAGVIVAQRVALTAAAAVDGSPHPIVTTATGVTMRANDVQRPAGTGLALLHFADDLVDQLDLAVATSVTRAAAIVALEPAEHGIATRWGFVTRAGARRVEAIYDGRPPALGAPLFDLGRRLVGVQGDDGAAHRAADVATLLAMPTAEPSPRRAATTDDEEQREPSATAFLDAIATVNGSGLLSPCHWAEPTDANAIDQALPRTLAVGDARIEELASGTRFMRPLRVMVHRVEVTRAVAPQELSSCARKPQRKDPAAATP